MAEQRLARRAAVACVFALVLGCILGLVIGSFGGRCSTTGMEPKTSDDEYVALRKELAEYLPCRDYAQIRFRAQKLSEIWPTTRDHVHRLLQEPAPQLQMAGLIALAPHVSEASQSTVDMARSFVDSKIALVRIAALRCLSQGEREHALLAEANRILSIPQVGWRVANGSAELGAIVEGLRDSTNPAKVELMWKIVATGDTVPLSEDDVAHLTRTADREPLKYLVPYLSNLRRVNGREYSLGLLWFQKCARIPLPQDFAAREGWWQDRALGTMQRWLREHPEVTDPTKPLPPLVLPEYERRDVDNRHR